MDSNLFRQQQSVIDCDRCQQYISNLLSNDHKVLDMTINYKFKTVNYGVMGQLDRHYEYYGPDFAKAVETFGALE